MIDLPPDASLELPVQSIAIQIGEEIVLEDGAFELRYLPVHKCCAVTIRIDDQTHASVVLDEQLFAVLAAFAADPTRVLEPGTVFKG